MFSNARTSGGVAEWLMAADCKSAGLTPYEGSNPSPTIVVTRTDAVVIEREVQGSVGQRESRE